MFGELWSLDPLTRFLHQNFSKDGIFQKSVAINYDTAYLGVVIDYILIPDSLEISFFPHQ